MHRLPTTFWEFVAAPSGLRCCFMEHNARGEGVAYNNSWIEYYIGLEVIRSSDLYALSWNITAREAAGAYNNSLGLRLCLLGDHPQPQTNSKG